jgi:hypothetical protein
MTIELRQELSRRLGCGPCPVTQLRGPIEDLEALI